MHLWGIPIDRLTVATLLARIDALIDARGRATVAYANVHVLNTAMNDPHLAGFLAKADVVYADGHGVVLGARWLGDELPPRMTGADWIRPFSARAAEKQWRIGWIGGDYGVVAAAARVLQSEYPALTIVFTHHGYTPAGGFAHDALLAEIRAANLDLLFVGMGTPVQERWVDAHRQQLDVPVVWCIGATADFISGRVSRGPVWLHQRQEWLARLLVDPRRLWKRYLLGNPRFVARVLATRWRR